MMISAIAAMGKNNELGFKGQLLWHVKEDFKNFKKITMNHHLIMGRKTYESIGKPLPGRTTIILSKNTDFIKPDMPEVFLCHTAQEALQLARSHGENEVFICGGAEIYRLFMPLLQRIYLSQVEFEGEADAFFPDIDFSQWKLLQEKSFPASDKDLAWQYKLLEKIN